MKTQSYTMNRKLSIFLSILLFTFATPSKAFQNNGKGIGGNNGATIEHSAYVNNNGNNGHAGEGNHGNGVGNLPYGNQGSNNNPNGRTGTRDSIPLDGGLSILLLGAAAFGVKKLRDKKN
ncbi:hypothetical protein GCM10007962_02700 [Yeosuana aromativorans]|uniref:Uncharacterized protein n=1 Tax=Yeosuana aromativorans TaxID=288019 RepID=A0A8J3BG77_9FLAO|nr:hypothetical protein [Yeosuana aromativorans]GGK11921.1 hypothetical protein GCM10007962_02700 [Yeosuana aromativorans]